jgi:flagellar FliL protein
MADEEKEKAEGTEEKPQKKSSPRWILLAGGVVVLGVAGYFGWSHVAPSPSKEPPKVSAAASPAPSPAKKTETAKIICPLDAFVVNLMDRATVAKRYLKVTMALEVGDEEGKAKVERHKTQLRDTIILLLTAQGFQDISSVEGKLGLKQEVLARVNQILGPGTVSRIYFTEFVVQ